MKRTILFTVVLLLLAALIGGFAYFQFTVKPGMVRTALTSRPRPPVTVTAAPAKTERWTPMLPGIGTFRAIAGIDVAPQVDGVVSAIHFDSGQTVKANTLLVELDDTVEQADLKSGIALLRKNQLDLDRQRQLLARGNTPKTNYDAALAQRDTAAAVVERTKAVIAHKRIRAPFAGRLGLRKVDLGQYVSQGTPLVTLQRLDPIYVDFPMPEQDVNVLAPGQSVEVRVDAYAGKVFKGELKSIDARVNQETRTVLVRAEVDNPDSHLLPGMFANVSVLAGAPKDVVSVPRTAVTYSLYGDSVYVVKPAPGTSAKGGGPGGASLVAERRFVRVGDTRGDRVAITEGIAAGETVITSGQIKLQPNARVVVDNSEALKPPAELPRE